MTRRTHLTRSLALAAVAVSTLAASPAGTASAGPIPDPNTQYQRISYHQGSRTGPIIGEYNYAGPCGEAYWWGSTSSYTTTSWITCPGM
jgi:hypothetical protein